jgi:hypothetical protein
MFAVRKLSTQAAKTIKPTVKDTGPTAGEKWVARLSTAAFVLYAASQSPNKTPLAAQNDSEKPSPTKLDFK